VNNPELYRTAVDQWYTLTDEVHGGSTMPTKIKVAFLVEPDGARFYAYCPALKGLHVEGDSIEEAVQNAADAASLYLNSIVKRGEPIPLGCDVDELRPSFGRAIRWTFGHRPRMYTAQVECMA
jgi:predicted RNase H-like HicB family nuclease